MANKEALRELQGRLAERLKLARTQERGKSWLAVESAGRGFLLPLKDAGEIFSLVGVLPVPHSLPWFLGVANLRGHLHGVVDLARFLGLDPVGGRHLGEAGRETARLVAFNAGLELNCALLVEKLAGLRNASQLHPEDRKDDSALPPFVGQRFRDSGGRLWQELSLFALAENEAFLKIVG
jgi:twitching motility protein PilI